MGEASIIEDANENVKHTGLSWLIPGAGRPSINE
jgi:hypothetical protein